MADPVGAGPVASKAQSSVVSAMIAATSPLPKAAGERRQGGVVDAPLGVPPEPARSTRVPYEGPYCVGCEEFKLPGDLVDGTGEYAGQQGLRDPPTPVEELSETNYFFRLSDVRRRGCSTHYDAHPEFVEPE